MFPASDPLNLDHESEAVRDLASLDGLVSLDAGNVVPVSGTIGLGAITVGIQFLSHECPDGLVQHYVLPLRIVCDIGHECHGDSIGDRAGARMAPSAAVGCTVGPIWESVQDLSDVGELEVQRLWEILYGDFHLVSDLPRAEVYLLMLLRGRIDGDPHGPLEA